MGISTFFGLNVGMSALDAAQQAESVISNNIANSNTPGYVQESPLLVEADPYPSYPSTNAPLIAGQMGQGTQVETIQRITNAFLNLQDRQNQGTSGMYDTLAQNMTQIEQIINEPSSQSLQNALDNFFSSWQNLSQAPNQSAVAQAVITSGQTLGQTFQVVTTQLENMQTNLSGTVQIQLQELNTYAQQVASLNQQIANIDALQKSGQQMVESPNQLEDQRGHIIDQMAKLANIYYTQNSDGTVSVSIGSGITGSDNIPLVQEMTAYTIATQSTTGGVPLTMSSYMVSGTGASSFQVPSNGAYMVDTTTSSSLTLDVNLKYVTSGQIAGNVKSIDEVNSVLAQFNAYLESLANEVNSIQLSTNAYTVTGAQSTLSFFTLSTTSANDVILNVTPTLTANGVTVSSGTAGYNDLVNKMVSQAWEGDPSVPFTYSYFNLETGSMSQITSSTSTTFDQMLAGYVSQLGINAAAANTNQQTADALAQQSSNLRQSISGVDLNEQAAQMVVYQNIYSAAAKFISIFDQMLQTAISMVS